MSFCRRNAFKYFWQPVTIDLTGNTIVQRNQPNPALPILLDRTWSLTKLEGPPASGGSNPHSNAGRFVVGGRTFSTRAEAHAEQRRELDALLRGADVFGRQIDFDCRVIVPSVATFLSLVRDPNADTAELRDFIATANQAAYVGVAEFLRATNAFRTVETELRDGGESVVPASHEVVIWLEPSSGQWFLKKPLDTASAAIPIDVADSNAARKWNAWCRRVREIASVDGGASVPPPAGGSQGSADAPKPMIVSGTGFVVDRAGIIVTNEHVIQGATRIDVHLADGSAVPARLIQANPDVDLAILAIDKELPISTTLRATDMIVPGEDVFVIGFPLPSIFSKVEGTITTGSVNALTGFENEIHVFRFQAPIQPGNSGGPIFDENGCVAGVCFGSMSPEVGQSLYYGIKSSTLREMLNACRVKWEACTSNTTLKASEIWTRYRDAVVRIECVVVRLPAK